MLPNNPNEEFLKAVAFQRLSPYMMQEKYSRMNGIKIAPDTIGIDYFFLLGFLTQQMEDDFPAIEHEFLARCRTKLDEFNAVGWYGAADITIYNPIQSLHTNILRLIYNGAKTKDAYCLELIKNLYKTYHKKEYNQLKRFRKLSGEDIVNLSENLENPMEEKLATARVLSMANFMGMEIDERCSVLYYLAMEDREVYLSALARHLETDMASADKFREYGDQINDWMKEALEKTSDKDEAYGPYLEAVSFISECFKQHGFSDDYMQLCTDEGGSRVQNLVHALAILKQLDPKKQYTLNDAYIYSSIVQLIKAFTDIISNYDFEVGFLLGDQLDDTEMDDVIFKPNSIEVKGSNQDKQLVKLVNIAPIADNTATKEDYLAEINDLRGRLKAKDQDIKHLRDKFRATKQTADDAANRIESLEADREELIALRNFVHNLKNEEVPEEDELAMMKDAISDKRIVIIGGHQNWHNKLKKLFPKWTLIYMDEFKAVTTSMLENHDYVFFYSDYLSHKSYNKCVAMLRENNIPFGYLHGINPDITIKQVYESI